MITMLIGARIAQLRHQRGLSQDALANLINISRSYLAEVETGKRNASIRNIARIAQGLNMTLAEFFDSSVFDPLYRNSLFDDDIPPAVLYALMSLSDESEPGEAHRGYGSEKEWMEDAGTQEDVGDEEDAGT